VIEVYALKEAAKNMDVSTLPNRGIYDVPGWIKDVKLQKSNDNFVPVLPGKRTLETLLNEMQSVPEWVTEEQYQDLQEEFSSEQEEELVVEEPEPPVMDPETPVYRRAALVKLDPDKRFDFMSNRPVPRASPVEPVVDHAETVKETVVVDAKVKSVTEPAEAVTETVVAEVEVESSPTLSSQPSSGNYPSYPPSSTTIDTLETSNSASEKNVAVLRKAVRDSVTALSSKSVQCVTPAQVEAKWRDVPLTDPHIKFAVSILPSLR
jgi:hypothetical protein